MIRRNWKRIIASLILIVMFFPQTLAYGEELNSAQIGEVLAKYSYSFCKQYGYDPNSNQNQTFYDHDNGGDTDRPFGYRLELHSGMAQRNPKDGRPTTINYSNRYPMDCVGVVSTMMHQALGIGNSDWEIFISPGSPRMQWFDTVIGTPQPGDILDDGGTHVKIYIGDIGGTDGNVVEGISAEWKGACITSSGYSGYTAYRIKDTIGITREQCSEIATSLGHGRESEFYFNGVPNGEYSVVGSIWEILVTMLKEIFKLLVNLLFFLFRMVFVGFTAIIDNLITYIVKTIMGVPSNPFKDATSGWRNDDESVDKVNIETIIFGNKDEATGEYNSIFDVNFFKPLTVTP